MKPGAPFFSQSACAIKFANNLLLCTIAVKQKKPARTGHVYWAVFTFKIAAFMIPKKSKNKSLLEKIDSELPTYSDGKVSHLANNN